MKPANFYELKNLFGLEKVSLDTEISVGVEYKGFFTSRELIISSSPLMEMTLVMLPEKDLWGRTGYLLLESYNNLWKADCTKPLTVEKIELLVKDIENNYRSFNIPSEKEFNEFLLHHNFYGTFI